MKIKLKYCLPIIIFSLTLFSGCRDESVSSENETNGKTVILSFSYNENPNAFDVQKKDASLTRSSNDLHLQEPILANTDLKFYLFNDDGKNSKFVYAPDPNEVIISKKNGSTNIYEANFKIPEDNYGKIKMIVLAHYNGENPSKGQTLDNFNSNNLKETLSGKYEINKTLIPLWGQCSFNGSKLQIETSVTLIRCMARISINIDDQLNNNLKNKIEKIKSVRIYRTLNKMALYVEDVNAEKDAEGNIIGVTKPTIPTDAIFNLNDGGTTSKKNEADKKPLLYDYSEGVKQADLIYIPEKKQDKEQVTTLNDAQAIVLGVKLKNINETRYYRVDIAEYKKGDPRPVKLLSILRNHHYQFSLGGSENGGTKNPEEALNAPANIYVSIQKWNDLKSDYELNGQYYFGIKSSDIKLPWKSQSGTAVNLSFEIDINEAKKSFNYKWLSNENGKIVEKDLSDSFELYPKLENKRIIIKVKHDNLTNKDKSQKLIIRFLKHQFELKIIQSYKPAQYEIERKQVAEGVYVVNEELNSAKNFVKIRLYASSQKDSKGTVTYSTLNGLRYHLTSENIEGYYFDTKGVFDNIQKDNLGRPYQEIKIPVQGKTTDPKNKRIMIKTDAEDVTYATVEIPVAYRPKKVLGVFGSGISLKNNGNFQKFLEDNGTKKGMNFGVSEKSAVKSEQITYVEIYSDLASSIKSEKPDVVIIGGGYSLTESDQDELSNYLKSNPNSVSGRGVVIAMNTDQSMFLFMRDKLKLLDPNKSKFINQESYELSTGQSIRKLYPVYENIKDGKEFTDSGYRYFMPTFDYDKIVNGPFGYLGAKSWKGDPRKGKYVTFPIGSKILKYSGMVPYGSGRGSDSERQQQRYDYGATFFRAINFSFIWVGYPDLPFGTWNFKDGKSIEQPYSSHGYICKNDGGNKVGGDTSVLFPINDGVVFSNLFNWALYQSEYAN